MDKYSDKQKGGNSREKTNSSVSEYTADVESNSEEIDIFSISLPNKKTDFKNTTDSENNLNNNITTDADKSESPPEQGDIKVDGTQSEIGSESSNEDTLIGAYSGNTYNKRKTEENFKNGYNGIKTEEDEESKEIEEYQPKRSIKVIKAIIYTVCLLLVSLLLAILILISATDFLGMFRPYKSSNVQIPKNSSISQIADILQDKGIIRSSLVFKAYMGVSGKSGLKSGTYGLDSEMSYIAIINKLKNIKNRATVDVTIPEGFNTLKVAKLLEEKEVCSSKDFLEAANNKKPDFDFAKDLPTDKQRMYNLEGYLFPDTYNFYVNEDATTVVKKMLDNFDKRVDTELRDKISKSGMTVDQAVTLASIIQAETGGSDQMEKVSSVFHNRLDYGANGVKMLQSDVTTLYGKNVILDVLGDEGQKLADSYDTYKVTGLPAGPISNPGVDAIKAAINPDKTSYCYFVTDKDGNYYYAKSLYQHNINVKKAAKKGNAEGTTTK